MLIFEDLAEIIRAREPEPTIFSILSPQVTSGRRLCCAALAAIPPLAGSAGIRMALLRVQLERGVTLPYRVMPFLRSATRRSSKKERGNREKERTSSKRKRPPEPAEIATEPRRAPVVPREAEPQVVLRGGKRSADATVNTAISHSFSVTRCVWSRQDSLKTFAISSTICCLKLASR